MNKVFENVFVKVLCVGNKVREKGRGKDSGTEGGRENVSRVWTTAEGRGSSDTFFVLRGNFVSKHRFLKPIGSFHLLTGYLGTYPNCVAQASLLFALYTQNPYPG